MTWPWAIPGVLLVGACSCSAFPPTDAAEVRAPTVPVSIRAAGQPFRIRVTEHFRIAYNTDAEVIRPLVGRLEGTFDVIWRFALAHDLADRPPDAKLEVIVFDSFEEFQRYGTRVGVQAGAMAGFYQPTTNVAAFCHMDRSPALANINAEIRRLGGQYAALEAAAEPSTLVQREQLRGALTRLTLGREVLAKRFNRLVLQHEAAHQVLFNLGIHSRSSPNPEWLVEGLACQFEVPQGDRSGQISNINHLRLGDLRAALGLAPATREVTPAAYAAALRSGRVAPLTELISGRAFAGQPEEALTYRYAQAWSLVHHLGRRDVGGFGRYVKQMMGRRPGAAVDATQEIEDFQAAFGRIDVALERRWLADVAALRFDPNEAVR